MASTQSTLPSHLDIACIRDAFPALAVNGPTNQPWLYFDGPGGTQVPESVAQAISHSILFASANRGAPFATNTRSCHGAQQRRCCRGGCLCE